MPAQVSGPRSASSRELLPEPPRERADAARNRRRVLDAAERLFREHGVDAVSMDAIARAAGVGKGTVFRRFGDRSGLAAALLDERERALQELMLSGPPPLGPGAPAAERAEAFVRAYLAHLRRALPVVRLSETASPGARYRIGSYRLWRAHLAALAGGAPDARYRAEAVLALLAADLVTAQLAEGATWADLEEAAVAATGRLLAC
ncbi:TetR/AcrR family transcriptional regulator [Geodermatophilus sp. DSM 44513]|uniref:TetR/AcrR family transcriptional regulator n=1 Tax=Geodermatophilus sp. DSM 44513 TaxID=1528104 RepID=UPI00127468FC|nr:TetR/AcrR family transcriptional regulator [Geodermatophilus sp. DSM 44513]WNV75641.1 helix-turn-helix domain-containing protein [Geodermatophilus sp. DSM 44513]